MTWIELDDKILDHPKFIRVAKEGGGDAIFLWLGLRAYCSQNLTDGFVPEDMLDEVRGPGGEARDASLACLKKHGLVDDAPGGVQLHDYLDWCSSREDVLQRRAAARSRKSRSRARHAVTVTVTPGVTDAVTDAERTPSVTAESRQESQTPARAPAGRGRGSGSSSPEGVQGEPVDAPTRCPVDLRLTDDELEALTMNLGITRWQADAMAAPLVAKFQSQAPRPLTAWRRTLVTAVTREWSDPARRPKPPPAPTQADLAARAARDRMEAEERRKAEESAASPPITPAQRAELREALRAIGGVGQ